MAWAVHEERRMDPAATAPIDVAEAAYDLQLGAEEWLPNLLEKGAPMLNLGLGCAAAMWAGQSRDGQPLISQLCVGTGSANLGLRFARAAQAIGPQLKQQTSAASEGGVRTASESELTSPEVLRALHEHVGCKDVLGVWAMDPDCHGVGINMPSSEHIRLSHRERERWQRLAVHIAAGHRIRRKLGCNDGLEAARVSDLLIEADALIDPKHFVVAHAEGCARDKDVTEVLRAAAKRVDQARSKLRRADADRALEVWQGLVRGQWSLVDWFDSDGRRFVVVVPNAPGLGDPRGLTDREHQVATYAALGESSKLITYRLGISRQRVSTLLKAVMKKLGVRTQAQLVEKMRAFRRV